MRNYTQKIYTLLIVIILTSCARAPLKQGPMQDKNLSKEQIEQDLQVKKKPVDKVKLSNNSLVVDSKEQDHAEIVFKEEELTNISSVSHNEIKGIKNNNFKTKPRLKKYSSIQGKVSYNLSKVKDKEIQITDTIVYFVPELKSSIPKSTFNIVTRNKRFVPSVLVVPVGSNVTFPNQDRILHNVFSVSQNAKFDLGLYAAGSAKDYTFDKTGVVYVNCNVHHSMQADILVVDTPFYKKVNQEGEFKLDGLPSLNGKLFVWHPRAALKEVENTSYLESLTIELDIIRARIPQHLNKLGLPYVKRRK